MKLFNWNKKADDSKAVVKHEPAPPAPVRSAVEIKAHEEIVASVILNGDISKLNAVQRVNYVKEVCSRVGIDWSTQPFQILRLNGKERLYATKDATDQLRKVHGVSIIRLEKHIEQGLCVFIATARDRSGKEDTSSGAVSIKALEGEQLANAIMKAETKAKRRVTLSICGLGMLDENEVESIQGAETKTINHVDVSNTATWQAAAPQLQPIAKRELTVEELHEAFMELLNEYSELVGMAEAHKLHPQNWKTPRELKNYQAAIPALKEKIKKAAEQRKEVVNG